MALMGGFRAATPGQNGMAEWELSFAFLESIITSNADYWSRGKQLATGGCSGFEKSALGCSSGSLMGLLTENFAVLSSM
jgi:hypothetical protein